jgi:hypothetical protein
MFRNFSRILFTPSVALGAVGITLLLCAISGLFLWLTSPTRAPAGSPTAALTVIPGPTATPRDPTATPPIPTATGDPSTSPLPGTIGIGSYVQIAGTDGDGLNIRHSPGLSTDVIFLGYDSEVFEVRDGPQEADGLTWWYLVTPVDEARSGWAAADYLSLVDNP